MNYTPHTEHDIKEMLERIGKESIRDLFDPVPERLRFKGTLSLPESLSEEELRREFRALARRNLQQVDSLHFLGGGAYEHIRPAVIRHLLRRSEFYSAYTPYQPEISQGTLQAIFEFQTLMCQLTGMDVSNASMYDGASSAAEAVLMCVRMTKKTRVLMAGSVHPEYRHVVRTYLQHTDAQLETIPVGASGVTDMATAGERAHANTACVVVQSPNFFGCIEEVRKFKEICKREGCLLVQIIAESLSLGLLTSPGEMGADVAVGDFQSFGIPLQYGGPYGGFLATRKAYVRHMPGRVVGETIDQRRRRGFVLTLSTREQHIRRGRATSNICTNHGLCALAATIFLALLGKNGLREIAEMNLSKAEYAKQKLREISSIDMPFSAPAFNEFVVHLPSLSLILHSLRHEERISAGIPLEAYYPHMKNHLLVCVTERHRREDIDRFVEAMKRQCQKHDGKMRAHP